MPARSAILSLVFITFVVFTSPWTHAQLTVLSQGNKLEKWRETQIASLSTQLESEQVVGQLRAEVGAQQKWLQAWSPGDLTKEPLWGEAKPQDWLVEPALDPNRRASALRKRLLGPDARPTSRDTKKLEALLREYPDDIGVRQLHLHWLDQRQYRKAYTVEIAEAASSLAALLMRQKKQTGELKAARAFCLYRAGRALAYRELPDVIQKRPIEDPKDHQAKLFGTYEELLELVGRGRPEFILLEVRLLRRDGWYGSALSLLEGHGAVIEAQWFLKKRRDLLEELGWKEAYAEAAEIYAKEFPAAVAEEKRRS